MKKCTKCEKSFPATPEYFNKSWCKICTRTYNNEWANRNRKKKVQKDITKMIKICKGKDSCGEEKHWSDFSENPKGQHGLNVRCTKCEKEYQKCLKTRKVAHKRKYYDKNKDECIKRTKDWAENNRDRKNEYYRDRRKTDPLYKLTANMRTGMSECLSGKKKQTKTFEYIGCSPSQLKSYLEKQFHDGMSWDNYGKWHVDHIKPLCSFDLTIEENLHTAWNYKNLQPLWASDNCSKGGKY